MNGQRNSPRTRRPFAAGRRNVALAPLRQHNQAVISAIRHTPRRMVQKVCNRSQQRENIRVVVRVRPPNIAESVAAHRTVVEVEDERVVVFDPKESISDFYYHGKKQNNNIHFRRFKEAKFVFDRVFSPGSTNEEVFNETIKQNLDSLMEGFNCSIFAYGATGSGKTFTMLGSGPENPGLTILTLMDLYDRLGKIEAGYTTAVSVSYLEIYNETVRDLLNSAPSKPGGLIILEDENGVSVPDLISLKPEGQSHLLEVLSEGNRRRTQHPTDHNSESSRSHAVFQVHVTIRAKFEEMKRKVCTAKLVMVDLAGSERASATRFNADRSREGASINRSLLALGNCINALADGKKHVPYRDSKLTRLLKDSLGGNCKTIVIANVSPSSLSFDDTHNTLKYADRAKHIRVNVKKNEVLLSARVAEYARVVQDMQGQINTLQGKLDLYVSRCTCLTSASEESPSDDELELEQNKNMTTQSASFSTFKNLKRRYQESKDSLKLTDAKVDMKKARLVGLESCGDWKAPEAAVPLRRQLSQLQQKRLLVETDLRNIEGDMTEVINAIPPEATVTMLRRELLRLQAVETQYETLLQKRETREELLKKELDRTQNLLFRSMSIATSIYQVTHVHKHTTKHQDDEYNALRQDYLGLPRRVHFADLDEAAVIDPPDNLNVTFALPVE